MGHDRVLAADLISEESGPELGTTVVGVEYRFRETCLIDLRTSEPCFEPSVASVRASSETQNDPVRGNPQMASSRTSRRAVLFERFTRP